MTQPTVDRQYRIDTGEGGSGVFVALMKHYLHLGGLGFMYDLFFYVEQMAPVQADVIYGLIGSPYL